MGTLVYNKNLDIDFEIPEILQQDLEVYERALGEYLISEKFDGSQKMESTLYSGVTIAAIKSELIPKDVLSNIEDVKNSSPKKIIFLSARIAEVIDAAKNAEPDIQFECPEITQGDLEKYEKIRNKIIDGVEYSVYETALSNSMIVQIGIHVGWISDKILKLNQIPMSNPGLIRYLSGELTVSLVDARSIPGE